MVTNKLNHCIHIENHTVIAMLVSRTWQYSKLCMGWILFNTSPRLAFDGGWKCDSFPLCNAFDCSAIAAWCQQSIDISCRPAPQQQTCHILLQRSVAETDRLTNTVPVLLNRPSLLVICCEYLDYITVYKRVFSAMCKLCKLHFSTFEGEVGVMDS